MHVSFFAGKILQDYLQPNFLVGTSMNLLWKQVKIGIIMLLSITLFYLWLGARRGETPLKKQKKPIVYKRLLGIHNLAHIF